MSVHGTDEGGNEQTPLGSPDRRDWLQHKGSGLVMEADGGQALSKFPRKGPPLGQHRDDSRVCLLGFQLVEDGTDGDRLGASLPADLTGRRSGSPEPATPGVLTGNGQGQTRQVRRRYGMPGHPVPLRARRGMSCTTAL